MALSRHRNALLEAILREGLKPGERQQVHLSENEKTARDVGLRHGKPVILRIDALGMHAQGFRFYRAENGVWLTGHVPVAFQSVCQLPPI